MIIWDIIARMFMCTPYAKRKSHKSRTSERGGVQAENVRTAEIREIYKKRNTGKGIQLGLEFLLAKVIVQFWFNSVKTNVKQLVESEKP
jgi:hypothetical protein